MCFTHERVCNFLYRCHAMLFVLVMGCATCVFTHERVCNCLFRCHSMLFVLVISRVTCVFTHERVCNCLQMSFYVVRARYEQCYMCFHS